MAIYGPDLTSECSLSDWVLRCTEDAFSSFTPVLRAVNLIQSPKMHVNTRCKYGLTLSKKANKFISQNVKLFL